MILTVIIKSFLQLITNIINALPNIPEVIQISNSQWTTYWDAVFNNLGLIDLIIPISMAKLMLGGILGLLALKWGYSVIMFIIHKIPFVNIR